MSLITINVHLHADEVLTEVNERSKHIMSQVTEAAAKQQVALDRINASLQGLQQDIKTLSERLTDLTPEEQAALDAVTARAEAMATAFEALDAQTPPPAVPGS